MRRIGRCRQPGGLYVTYYAGDGTRELHIPRLARWRVDLNCRVAEVTVRPGAERCLRTNCTSLVLCEFLAQVGHHVVHAASLSTGARRNARAVLVSGVSGLGKSTTALALAHSGMKLMADDASFVGQSGKNAALRVWGLPRPCKVHRRTLALLPWLADLPRRSALEPDEEVLDLCHVPGARLTQSATPALILFLEPRNSREHRLTPMDKTGALMRLTRENVRALETTAEGPAGQAFLALGQLVEQCKTYLLSVGPRLDTLYGEILPLLEAV